MRGGRVRRVVTWETERFLQGVERCVLQGQMGMSRTQNGQNIPGKGSQPESESLISPLDSIGTM